MRATRTLIDFEIYLNWAVSSFFWCTTLTDYSAPLWEVFDSCNIIPLFLYGVLFITLAPVDISLPFYIPRDVTGAIITDLVVEGVLTKDLSLELLFDTSLFWFFGGYFVTT